MSNLRIVFLGTGGGMPSKKRGLPSVALRYEDKLILFDCGESTQRHMILAGVGFKRDLRVLISHLHGDHVLGLPGLLYSMSMLERTEAVHVHGPRGLKSSVELMLGATRGEVSFPVEVHEIDSEGPCVGEEKFTISAAKADHVTECFAYSFEEKQRPGRMLTEKLAELGIPRGPLWGRLQRGQAITYKGKRIEPEEVVGPPRRGRKVVYSGDTRPCRSVAELARDADVLIHDSSLDEGLADRAMLEGHSTSVQAAEIAKEAGVGRLFLFHISPRYDEDPSLLSKQAKSVFSDADLAEDLLSIEVRLPD